MDGGRRIDINHLATLALLGALWGGSFFFIEVSVHVLGPVALMALRVTLAGAALVLYAAVTGRLAAVQMNRRLLVLGCLNAAIPFTLIAVAQLRLTTATAAILNATMPLFAAVIACVWDRQPVAGRRAIGLGLGIVGVALVVGWAPVLMQPSWLLSAAAALLASLSYAVAVIYASRRLHGTSSLTLAIGQQLGAAVVLLPLTLLWPPRQSPSWEVIGAVLGLAVLSTALGFILYFYLITSAGPVTAASVTFLIPMFGILWGVALHGNLLERRMLIGLVAILMGVFLVRDAQTAKQPTGVNVRPFRWSRVEARNRSAPRGNRERR